MSQPVAITNHRAVPASDLPVAVSAWDLPDLPPPPEVIESLWTGGEIGVIAGEGGTGKSTIALHFAAAIAGGYPVFDYYRVDQAPTLIVSAEDDAAIVRNRLFALCAGHEWDAQRTLQQVFVIASPEVRLGQKSPWVAHLEHELQRVQPRFVVVDPYAEVIGGDEDSSTEARPVIQALRHLSSATGTAIAVVHHVTKAAGREGRPLTLDDIRGSSALRDAARVVHGLEHDGRRVLLRPLKMSRRARPDAFSIDRDVTVNPKHPTEWVSARLTLASLPGELQPLTALQERVLAAVTQNPGLSGRAVMGELGEKNLERAMAALRSLQQRGLIFNVPGPRKSLLWHASDRE